MDGTAHHECAFLPGSIGSACCWNCVFLYDADCHAGHVDERGYMKLNFWEAGLLFAVILLGRPWNQIELAFYRTCPSGIFGN